MGRLAEAVITAGLGGYADRGFRAYEDDDHVFILEHDGKIIGRFSAVAVTPQEIQDACNQHLNEDIFVGLNG